MKTALLMRLMLRFVRGDTERVLLEVVDYLMAESRVFKKKYEQDGGKRLLLSDQPALPGQSPQQSDAMTSKYSGKSLLSKTAVQAETGSR